MNDSRQSSEKPIGRPKLPTCNHYNKQFRCATLRLKDVRSFHESFYSTPNKIQQDNFLLTCIKIRAVTEHRITNGTPSARSSRYFITNAKQKQVPVCLNAFLEVLKISRFRINRVTRQYFCNGEIKENRGGSRNRKEFKDKSESIVQFFEKLRCAETHYCCDGKMRKYLPADLSIPKLHQMYIEGTAINEEEAVKKSYFQQIFRTKFNFAFGSPRADDCVACIEYQKKIRAEKDAEKKEFLETKYHIHEMRAKAFFKLLESPTPPEDVTEIPDDTLILSFDFDKNLPLLLVPDSAVYLSHNVHLYNFTIVQGYSNSQLSPDNVVSYCWTENEYPKDTNMIASCILHHLSCTDLAAYKRIRLVADGCAARNKNSILVTALLKWFNEHAPNNIVDIELVFPIMGHAFIPPDNVFAHIECKVSKKDTIVSPDEYVEIIGKFATVKKVGADVPVLDIEAAMNAVMRPSAEWIFSASQVRRILLRKSYSTIGMKGELFYTCDVAKFFTGYCKDGKSLSHLVFHRIEERNLISREKRVDLQKLLEKHFGADWRALPRLSFFIYLLDVAIISDVEEVVKQKEDETDNEAICCFVEGSVDVMV